MSCYLIGPELERCSVMGNLVHKWDSFRDYANWAFEFKMLIANSLLITTG